MVVLSWRVNYCINTFSLGYGEETFRNGNSYKGYYKDNLYHGEGILTTHSSTYKGKVVNVLFACIMLWLGSFKNGMKSGKGILTFRNRHGRYEGDFEQGRFHGMGRYVWNYETDGRRYNGNWIRGFRSGHGILIFPTGESYGKRLQSIVAFMRLTR